MIRLRITEDMLQRLLPRVMAVLAACAMPMVAYTLVARMTASRMFLVSSVEVHGAEQTPESELLAAAGLQTARNILTLDRSAVERGLEAHPWVRSADAIVDLRDRSVVIDVEERRLAGISVADAPTLVDTYGETIRRWQPSDGLDVPVLVPVSAHPEPLQLRQMLDVADLVSSTDRASSSPVAEVQDRGALGYRIRLEDGFEVVVARSDTDRRIGRLDAAIRAAGGEAVATYALADGADPDRIVIGTRDTTHPEETQR